VAWGSSARSHLTGLGEVVLGYMPGALAEDRNPISGRQHYGLHGNRHGISISILIVRWSCYWTSRQATSMRPPPMLSWPTRWTEPGHPSLLWVTHRRSDLAMFPAA